MNRKVLVVGYSYMEPNMGGVRLRRVARHLPRHGWDPIVLTRPRLSARAEADSPGVRVVEVRAPDLVSLANRLRRWRTDPPSPRNHAPAEPRSKNIRLTSLLNRWVMLPDKQLPWYRAALKAARAILREEPVAAIFASLDPRTCVLVATRLTRESGVPAVIEFRDLWTGNPYYHVTQPTAFHRWAHGVLERRAIRHARRVTTVCRGIADYLNRRYAAELQTPVALNYNFFDAEEYPRPGPPQRPEFTISYTGALYGERSPQAFFHGLRRFIDQRRLSPTQVRFCWAGGAAGIPDLDQMIDDTGLRPHLEFLGHIPHGDALRVLMSSHVALLLQAPGDAIHIPGKLFEAMGARVPLLAITGPCEVADLIVRCQAGRVCPHSPEAVAAALAEFHEQYLRQTPWTFCQPEVDRFAAPSAVGQLAALLAEAAA